MASPFSFHCMICFEEFDIERRYPVVLPCGHTYVCNQCAERLEKCMECRTSLVQIIPRAQPGPDPARWSSRSAVNRSPGTPPQAPIKKRLPLPKNVVLMSLIEATELASENVRNQAQRPSLEESPALNFPTAILDLDEDEDEEEKIRAGTSLAISECGTYAVAAKEGLEIFPTLPGTKSLSGSEQAEDEEVDTMVKFFHLEQKNELSESRSDVDHDSEHQHFKENRPIKLCWGDRVQIVSTEAGWAKLARGYGYLRADRNQLVKVGSSVDRACKLEALLRLLSTRRKELRHEQKRVDNQFISLMNELQMSLMSDEDMTVIAADTFQQKQPKDYVEELKMEKLDLEQPLSQEVDRIDKYDEDSTPLKPRPMERPITPPQAMGYTRGFFCSGGDMLGSVLTNTITAPRSMPTTRNPAIMDHLQQANSNLTTSTVDSAPRSQVFHSAANPSPSALRAGARAWREMHGDEYSSNDVLGGIDFRTGMSGHAGLASSSSHPHDYLNPRGGTVNFRGGFSNHSGLSRWKKKSTARGPSPNSHLTMPMFGVDNTSM